MKHHDVTFRSAGVACHAAHVTGAGDGLATDAGRPVVVMAHGLGGTVDSGLMPFAEALAAAGLDVLAFDYRGSGPRRASRGRPSRWPASSTTTVPRWPPPHGCPESIPDDWCSGESRSPEGTCSPRPPIATTSPRWSR